MLLKTLSLSGFKSFADRTRLTFDSGVNVVVGPNGSGKSNLLDAMAWVMGTQATSTLRTSKMEDVIFAGTSTRPSLRRAEVSLTFDNSDGFLPLDLAEITMSRRLYRDGTSEYELNGTPCRLLDLQELLSDGGVGRHQHVLVGQGQIGQILSARPDEHRAVIEEAAGITKHRSRRDRSVRRLEHTDSDIERLKDILVEQRKRLRPLKRQANAAEQYDGVKAQARALRLWIGAEALRGIDLRLETAGAEDSELAASAAAGEAELVDLKQRLEELRGTAGDVGKALQRDTTAAARLETISEKLRRIAMVARERRTGLESRARGSEDRRRDLEEELSQLDEDIAECRRAEAEAIDLADRRESALRHLEDEERSLSEQLQLPGEGLLVTLRGDLRALEIAGERDRREATQIEQRRTVVEARLASERDDAAVLVAQIRDTDGAVTVAEEAYRTRRDAREAVQAVWDEAEADLHESQLAVTEAQARLQATEDALAQIGDPEARRRTAQARQVLGTVLARLDAPTDLLPAVEAALGPWADAFAVDAADDITEVAAALKSEGLGGVSLFAVADATATSSSPEVPSREIAASLGLDALVDALGAGADLSLASALMGDVVLAEGWSTAWSVVKRHPRLRAVTPEGDLISARAMHLALPDGAGPAALEAAAVALEVTERDLARARSRHATSSREFDSVRADERECLEALEQLEAQLAGVTEALALNERAIAASEEELNRLGARETAIAEARTDRSERIGEIRERIQELEEDESGRKETWEALHRRRDEVARRRDEARRLREEAAASRAGVGERLRLLQNRIDSARREMESIDDRPVDPAALQTLEAVEESARRAYEVIAGHIEQLRDRQRALRSQAGTADAELDDSQRRHDELLEAMADARDRRNALAIETTELRVRRESEGEMLRRDADATEQEALAAPQPEVAEDTDHGELLASLEQRLRRMGPVNPLAAAEYQELSEHVVELESQLEDLEESRTRLKEVIKNLDDEMAARFLGAFEEITALYEETFALVFPGGRGRLRLTDPDRPLETGVELEAQPLGKKVGRLSLLSGGERSLAALAFLFAVFRARPSPFYVLDEVDAALDDANIRRFLRLVDTLRNTAQLVIITHQQQTMEAADVLYGVTMEPGESSIVISKRFEPAIV